MNILQSSLHTYLVPKAKAHRLLPCTAFSGLSTMTATSPQLSPPENENVAAIVFGDDSVESRGGLYPLTKRRSEGAVPLVANYRLIDGVVSNCINSNINKIYALTQCNSTSLNSHLTRAFSTPSLGKDCFLEVIAACQTQQNKGWCQGTADAIRRCLWLLEEYPASEFLVLPGHHLYKMDYQKLIEAHRNNKADVTCAVLTSTENRHNSAFGVFKVDNLENNNKITEFWEKEKCKQANFTSVTSYLSKPNDPRSGYFPGIGIYVISRVAMRKLLHEYFPNSNDLTSEVIPDAISKGMKVHAYRFAGYWEDMRSIEAFYRANMQITKIANMDGFNFYDKDFPLYTLPRDLPPSLITDAVITDSVVGDGCILSRCIVRSSVVGLRTRVGDGAVIEDSILMGSDVYQTQDMQINGIEGTNILIGIGEGSHIKKAIVDKNARIGKNVMIINKDNVQEANMEDYGYTINAGIVVILRSATIQDGTIL